LRDALFLKVQLPAIRFLPFLDDYTQESITSKEGKISRHGECTYLIRFVDLLLEPGERHDAVARRCFLDHNS